MERSYTILRDHFRREIQSRERLTGRSVSPGCSNIRRSIFSLVWFMAVSAIRTSDFIWGDDICTMDFNGPIPREALKEIEQEANRAVFQNLDIQISYPSKEELKELDYRSKIEIDGQVRVLTVPGYDVCACCAPHVKRTGEIGLIKLVGMVKYKGGERISMLCGSRALLDYEIKDENAKRISALLCAKEYEVADAVERMKEEQASLKGKLASFQQKLLSYQAAQIPVEDKVTAVFDLRFPGMLQEIL